MTQIWMAEKILSCEVQIELRFRIIRKSFYMLRLSRSAILPRRNEFRRCVLDGSGAPNDTVSKQAIVCQRNGTLRLHSTRITHVESTQR